MELENHLIFILRETISVNVLSFINYFSIQMMKLIAVRRVQMAQTGKTDVPLPPAPPPHPGYAPNAALHAIKRHAQEFATPKAQAVSIIIKCM